MISIQFTQTGLMLPVRVTPKSSRDAIGPYQPEMTHVPVKVTAPPEDGKANQAVIAVLAATLGVSKSSVSIAKGHTSRLKQVLIAVAQSEAPGLLTALDKAMGGTEPRDVFII